MAERTRGTLLSCRESCGESDQSGIEGEIDRSDYTPPEFRFRSGDPVGLNGFAFGKLQHLISIDFDRSDARTIRILRRVGLRYVVLSITCRAVACWQVACAPIVSPQSASAEKEAS